jgi:hypothetical protein
MQRCLSTATCIAPVMRAHLKAKPVHISVSRAHDDLCAHVIAANPFLQAVGFLFLCQISCAAINLHHRECKQ